MIMAPGATGKTTHVNCLAVTWTIKSRQHYRWYCPVSSSVRWNIDEKIPGTAWGWISLKT